MWDKKKYLEVAIGLHNIILPITLNSWYAIPDRIGPPVMATASAILVFGALKARRDLKINIQIFWLLASVFFLATMLNNAVAFYYTELIFIRLLIYTIALLLQMLWIYQLNVNLTNEDTHPEDKSTNKPHPQEEEFPKKVTDDKVQVV